MSFFSRYSLAVGTLALVSLLSACAIPIAGGSAGNPAGGAPPVAIMPATPAAAEAIVSATGNPATAPGTDPAAGDTRSSTDTEALLAQVPAPELDPVDSELIDEVMDPESIEETDVEALPVSADELAREGDLWNRVRSGFQLGAENIDHPLISQELRWYSDHQAYLDRTTARASRYLHYIIGEAEKRGLPLELALLPVVESAYDPYAYSPAAAAGLWQFIPGTGALFGLKRNWWYDGRRDVVESTRAAFDFLQKLHSSFHQDWLLALAAYNSGPGTVKRAIERNLANGKPTDFWSLDLPRETSTYVPKLIAIARIIKAPEHYQLNLLPILNQPTFREVRLNEQVDLAKAAEVIGIELKELYLLNPAFSRYATDPDGPHRLLVPIEAPTLVEDALLGLPPIERLHTERYTVKRGDTLYAIAHKYHTTADSLKRLNGMKNEKVKPGSQLLVMHAERPGNDYALSQENRERDIQSRRLHGKTTLRHRVNKGETLSSLARKYRVSVADLRSWNHLKRAGQLRAGQKILVVKPIITKHAGKKKTAASQKAAAKKSKAGKSSSKKAKKTSSSNKKKSAGKKGTGKKKKDRR